MELVEEIVAMQEELPYGEKTFTRIPSLDLRKIARLTLLETRRIWHTG